MTGWCTANLEKKKIMTETTYATPAPGVPGWYIVNGVNTWWTGEKWAPGISAHPQGRPTEAMGRLPGRIALRPRRSYLRERLCIKSKEARIQRRTLPGGLRDLLGTHANCSYQHSV